MKNCARGPAAAMFIPACRCGGEGTRRPPPAGPAAAGVLTEQLPICDFLERAGLELAWRPARLLADDFCWQFCDDGALQLDFALGAGCYATALLAEIVQFEQVHTGDIKG